MKTRKPRKRKDPMWAKLFLAGMSLTTVALSVLLKVMQRQETVKVIESDETLTLLKAQKETKALKE